MSSLFQAVIHFVVSGLDADGALARQLRAAGVSSQDLVAMPTSLELARELRMIGATSTLQGDTVKSGLAEAVQMADLLTRDPGLRAIGEGTAGPTLIDCVHRTHCLADTLSPSIEAVDAARSDLQAVAAAVQARLSLAERIAAAETLEVSLAEAGYEVQVASGSTGTAIWAEQGDRVLAAVVGASGTVDIDLAGHDGATCVSELNTVIERIEANGAVVSQVARTFHGDPNGSVLIPAVGERRRRDGLPPAEALLATTTAAEISEHVAGRRSARRPLGLTGR